MHLCTHFTQVPVSAVSRVLCRLYHLEFSRSILSSWRVIWQVPLYIGAQEVALICVAFALKGIFHPFMSCGVTVPTGRYGQAFFFSFFLFILFYFFYFLHLRFEPTTPSHIWCLNEAITRLESNERDQVKLIKHFENYKIDIGQFGTNLAIKLGDESTLR